MNKEYAAYMKSKKKKDDDIKSSYSQYVKEHSSEIAEKKKANDAYAASRSQASSSTKKNSQQTSVPQTTQTSSVPSKAMKAPTAEDAMEYVTSRDRYFGNTKTASPSSSPASQLRLDAKYATPTTTTSKTPFANIPQANKAKTNIENTIALIDENEKNGVSTKKLTEEERNQKAWEKTAVEYDTLDDDAYALLDTVVDVQTAENRNASAQKNRLATAQKELKNLGYTDDEIVKLTRYHQSKRNAETANRISGEMEKMAEEHPFLASAASVALNMASPLGIVEIARAKKTGTPIDPNSSWFAPTQMTSDIREEVQENYDWNVDINKDGKSWDAFDFVYGSGMSIADSMVAGTMMPSLGITTKSANWAVKALTKTANSLLGGSLIGAQAMTSTIRDVARRGGTTDQAISAGVVSFLAETLSEAWSLGNFKGLQESGKRGLKHLAVDLLKSSGVNASEETVTEVVNLVYDRYALGNKSNYELNVQAYMQTQKADGSYYTREEAENLAWWDSVKQIGEAAASGAFQGFIMGGTGSTIGRAQQRASDSQMGAAIRESGEAENTINAARASDDKAVQEWVERINKTDKTTGEVNVKDDVLGGAFRALAESESKKAENAAEDTTETAADDDTPQVISTEEKVNVTNPTLGRKDGKVVSLSSVEAIKDGVITVKDSNGETQTLNIDSLTDTAKKVWSYAAENFTDANAIESFVQSYEGGRIETYGRVFKGVYDLAATGMTAEQILKEDLLDIDTIGQRAFDAAVKAGNKSISYKIGTVDLTTKPKTNSQKITMRIADTFGKKHGMNIVFVDTLSSFEGKYNPETNQIVIALDASGGAISRTLGHETFHYLKHESPLQAKNIEDFVISTMTRLKGKEWVDNFIDSYDHEIYTTLEARTEEFVADQMFEVFSSERAVKEFVVKDMTFAQKVLSHIRNLIADIKNIYNKLISEGYEDIAAWQSDLDALEKLNDMMLDALNNIEQKNTSASKAEKNTAEAVTMSTKRTFSYEELTSKPDMKLTVLSESVPTDTNGKINRGILVDKAIQNVKTIGHTNKNGNGEVFVKDVGRNVAISKASIRHGIDRRIETQAPVLMHIGEVISNSIEVNRLTPKKNTASGSYILLGAAKDGDNIYVVSSVVNRYTNSIDSIDVLYSANIKRESAVSKTRASGKPLQSLTDSTISVSDLLEIVKDKTPEILSSDVLNHFGMTRGNGEIENALMFSTKREQLDIINETNPAPNTYSTWIRTVDDIKTLSETLEDEDWEYEEINPDLTRTDIQNAIESGEITVYSSYPIENGVFVSPSRMEAESYSGDGRVYEKTVDINDVAWIDPTQGQYAKFDNVKFSTKRAGDKAKSPDKLTESDVKSFLTQAIEGELHEGTYFPVRRNTPKILIDSALTKNGDVIENLPIIIQVKKSVAHNISADDMISIIKAMDDPQYIIYQEDNDRYVEVVKYDTSRGSKAIAVLEIGDYKSNSHLNGYPSGSYNVLVTAFEPDTTYVSDILSKSSNVVIYKRIKGVSQVTFGSTVPSVLNESPFADSITENGNNVNGDNKFSTKRQSSVSEDASDYITDTKEFKEIIDIADQRYRLTNHKKLSPQAIDRFAGRLLSKSHSKYSREQLAERLTALFDYMANNGDSLVWEDVMKSAAEIAYDILAKSSSIDRSMQNQYKDTLDYLKGVTVYISPEVRAEIDSRYGNLENYRKSLGGKIKITVTDSSKISLDSLWQELNGLHPEMFDAETTPLDQAEELANFFDMVKPRRINQYDYYMDMNEAAYDFAYQIYDEYFNIPEIHTKAQRFALKEERLKGKYNAKVAEIRKGYEDRMKKIRSDYQQRIKDVKATDRERYEKLRSDKNRRIEETKALYRERNRAYREKRNDTQERQHLRAQIVRTSKKLTDMLVNPTEQKHIPQELIVGINSFARAMTEHGAFSAKKAASLQGAFNAISEKGADPDFNIASMYDESIAEMLNELTEILSDKRLSEMSAAELRKIKDIAKYFSHIVAMSNKAFSEDIKESLSSLQANSLLELSAQKKDKKRMWSSLQTGLLKPVTFFELLESPTMERLYTSIRKGEEKWARIVLQAKEECRILKGEYSYEEWKDDKIEIETVRGDKLAITVKEALSIYATSKRKQGVDHIMKGGIVLEADARKKLGKFSKKDKTVNVREMNVPLSLEDIQAINAQLTEEQTEYADRLVEYMSKDMAKYGNEVSMRLYGIQKFNEDYYFPIKSASNFLYSKPGIESDARIKHMSMTKKTVPKANNPVVIGDFTETAMSHCNDMAMYGSFTLPLEDFNRVWNYRTPATETEKPTSIKQKIDMAYGDKANKYIKQLLTDINGGVTQQAGAGFVNKMIGLAKKNAVFGSLSVAVQQPSAIARAMAYVNPKYFYGWQRKGTWDELKRYAPVAVIKEMGYFDTNIGKQAVEWMTETEYKGLKEKAFAFFKDGDFRDDVLSFLPAYMDEISWGRIWVAVKNEIAATRKDLNVGTEEFFEAAAERFTYVVDRTQVYDSVFARSEWMRSKDTGVKTATAFMSEPLTNYNLLYNAAVKAKNGDKKFAVRAITAYAVSVVFNSLLKSLVTAARDDDEDKSYWEKYLANLIGNIVDEPLGMIPYLKDIVSIFKGYDSSRMDTQVLADIADSVQTLFDSDKTAWDKVKSLLGAVGIATGVPFKNILRDGEMIIRGAKNLLEGKYTPTTSKGIEYAVKEELGGEVPTAYAQLVDALVSGDKKHYSKVYDSLIAEKEKETILKGVKSVVKERFQNGDISRDDARKIMREVLEMDANKIYWTLDEWETPVKEGETYSKYDDFHSAVSTGKNIASVARQYTQNGVSKQTLAGQITSEFKDQYIDLYKRNPTQAATLKNKLLNAYVVLGYDRQKKSKDIDNWVK